MAKTRRSHRRNKRKNIIQKGYKTLESTSQKVMPKVKTSLENVGSQVTKGVSQSVPMFKRLSDNFFGLFTRKQRS
jgi:hypothetical protein